MRNAATHGGKDLAREIALLKKQLDDLASSASDTGDLIIAHGESMLGRVKKGH